MDEITIVYQDRLGTNLQKTLTKQGRLGVALYSQWRAQLCEFLAAGYGRAKGLEFRWVRSTRETVLIRCALFLMEATICQDRL
jgi:hypothetical protein